MKTVVLLFEEDYTFAESIKWNLEKSGDFIFILTQTLSEAYKAIDRYKPSLVIINTRISENFIEIKEIVEYLKIKYQILIIFTSNLLNDKTALIDYPSAVFVLKVHLEEVIKLIQKFPETKFNEEFNDVIFISKNKRHFKVLKKDIYYIYADHGCIKIKTKFNSFLLSSSLSSFKSQIDDKNFISIHRSYIINAIHIDSFDANNLLISNDTIPISKKGMSILLERVKRIKSK